MVERRSSGVFLVDEDVPVARDAEGGGVLHRIAGEELTHVGSDEVLEQHVSLLAGGRGQAHQPAEHGWHLNDRHGLGAHLAPSTGALFLSQHHREVERLVAQVREGVTWIHRQGRQSRKHLGHEVRPCRRALLAVELARGEEMDAIRVQLGQELLAPDLVVIGHQGVRALGDSLQLLAGQHPVRRGVGDAAEVLLLEARHTDHEELVEVRGDDGEELEPFEERHVPVACLLENPLIKLQPGELAVD